MTSKLSWIAFVPFTLAALAIKVIQVLFMGEDGTFMGFNSLMLSYLAVACTVAVLLFTVIFCFIDKKTASVYPINKNFFAGIFGLVLAVALACDGANRAFNIMRTMTFEFFELADIVLTLLCAIVFVVLGLNHFVGNGGVKGIAVFYLIPALWCAFRLVKCFLEFTSVSIAVTDITKLTCYIFATLFLFNYAMIVALMQGKSPVRSAFIYGLPAVTILLSYVVYEFLSIYANGVGFKLFNQIEIIELCALGLYTFAFVVEMSACVKRKDQIEIVEDEADDEYIKLSGSDSQMLSAVSASASNSDCNDSVQNAPQNAHFAIDDEVFIEVAQTSLDVSQEREIDEAELSDYIYGAMPSEDDFVMPVENENDTPYTQQSIEEVEAYITKEDGAYDLGEDEEAAEKYVDEKLDRIDKLILEITEDELN